jgi:hypothetical protein
MTCLRREVVEADGISFRCETTRLTAGDRLPDIIRTGVAEEFLSSTHAYRSESSAHRRDAYRRRRSNGGQVPVGADQSKPERTYQ